MTARRALFHKVLNGTQLGMEEYEVLKDLIVPLGRAPHFSAQSGASALECWVKSVYRNLKQHTWTITPRPQAQAIKEPDFYIWSNASGGVQTYYSNGRYSEILSSNIELNGSLYFSMPCSL